MKSKTLSFSKYLNTTHVFWLLIFLIVAQFLLYLVFVQGSVYYLVASHKWESDTRSTLIKISKLESEYYTRLIKVDRNRAERQGLVAIRHIDYVRVNATLGEISYLPNAPRSR